MPRILILLFTVATAGVAVGGAQRPSATPATGTGMIIGQVVDAQSGDGIGGVSVYLSTVSGPIDPLIADSKGRFFFSRLPPNRYAISAMGLGASTDVVATTATSQVLDVAEGETIRDVRVDVLRYGSASGSVVDDAGAPVVGVGVVAFRAEMGRTGFRYVRAGVVQTDDRGVFQYARLRPGDYLFCACDYAPLPIDAGAVAVLGAEPGNLVAAEARAMRLGVAAIDREPSVRRYARAFYPTGSSIDLATTVTLASGEGRDGIAIQTSLEQSVTVSGRVVGMTGPLSAGSARLEALAGGADLAMESIQPAEAHPDGRFLFWGVSPGDYRLTVRHRPMAGTGAPSGTALALLGARGQDITRAATAKPVALAGQEFGRLQLSVGNSDIADIELPIQSSLSLSGKATFVGNRPSPSATDMGRMSVGLESIDDSTGQHVTTARIRLSEAATFDLPGVPPGAYALLVSTPPGFKTLESVTIDGRDVTDQPLEIGLQRQGEIVVTVSDAPPATLTGRVATDGTSGESPAMLVSFPTDRRSWAAPIAALRRFQAVGIDQKGYFSVTGLPQGEYYLAVVENRLDVRWQSASRLDELAQNATRVTVLPGITSSVEVHR